MTAQTLKRRIERLEPKKLNPLEAMTDEELDTAIDELRRSIAGEDGPFPFLSGPKYQAVQAWRARQPGGTDE
jgi:hypothetical protein